MTNSVQKYERRQRRIRSKLKRHAQGSDRLRLSVFRSNNHIYAQIIDDLNQKTLVSASSTEPSLKSKLGKVSGCAIAEEIGKEFARRAAKAGCKKVYFDRGAFPYHGRVAALANGARAEGLEF
ncbi:MAG: 50S ribosomal protein L18 [Alphaproteobacteria bacterium]|nr:MAG: 50S ribosomal protein L18 [Alphaproteobacteria bacterium]